jgi:hypothetical protein
MKKIIIISLFFVLILTNIARSQGVTTLTTQGFLRDPATNGALPNGTYHLTFRLYNVATGGTAIWVETHNVQLRTSMFNVTLGSVYPLTSLAFDAQYWLGISVNGGAELSPRTRLTAASYAMTMLGTENQFPSSGEVSVGGGNVEINGTGHGIVFPDDSKMTTKSFKIDSLTREGGTNADVYVDNDGKVGIGTTTPDTTLHVAGDMKINGNLYAQLDTLHVGGNLNIRDTLLVDGERPIRIERYTFENNDNVITYPDTNYSYNDWVAVIAGFDAGNMDYEENNTGTILQVQMTSWPTPNGPCWMVIAQIRAESGAPEEADWDVDVMYIRRNIAKQE